MISIIISSCSENRFLKLKNNIKETIGAVEYELLKHWNPGIKSISEAYNESATKAKFKYLIFLHEDIEFLNFDWGQLLIENLKQRDIGIVGLAGVSKRFEIPSGIDLGLKQYRAIGVIHHKNEKIPVIGAAFKAKSIDGVFLGMRKEVWEAFRFNEHLKGFHGYDLDVSLRVSTKFQNVVLPNVVIHHFSKGGFGNDWINTILKIYNNKAYVFDKPEGMELNLVRNYWYQRLQGESITLYNKFRYIVAMGINKATYKAAVQFLLGQKKGER